MITWPVALLEGQPATAIMLLVMVYVPAVLALKSIWPVEGFLKIRPVDEALKTPALAPVPKTGKGSLSFLQNGPLYENRASGVDVMVMLALLLPGQLPPYVNTTVYFPGVLAPILISPVVLLTNTRPPGCALKVPPDGLCIAGEGFAPAVQNVPEAYWNWGLGTDMIDTVTAVRGLTHDPFVFWT
jgi:hypothetical protein